MKIYTKNGDAGMTSIIGGQRLAKSASRVRAYGSVDEINSWVGTIVAELDPDKFALLIEQLIQLQRLLFDIGTDFATPTEVKERIVTKNDLEKMEEMIDFYQEKLPVIDKFILPGGHPVAGHFHLARTVTRRAEREITQLILEETETNQMSYKLINRLSDLFFVLASYVNVVYHIKEPFYERAGKVFH